MTARAYARLLSHGILERDRVRERKVRKVLKFSTTYSQPPVTHFLQNGIEYAAHGPARDTAYPNQQQCPIKRFIIHHNGTKLL